VTVLLKETPPRLALRQKDFPLSLLVAQESREAAVDAP